MIFEQLNTGACRTYLIASEGTNEAILVDPVLEEVDRYIDELNKREMKLKYVIDTHTHADHISGGRALNDRTGAKYIMFNKTPLECVDIKVDEKDKLELGDISIRFLHTPGHTKDSMTLILPDRILTGDALFIGGAGRTDLIGGDPAEHYDSLFKKLKPLDDSLLVYPAHDYHNNTFSTLGDEKKNNGHFQERTKKEYVSWLESMHAPMPEWMKEVIQENYSCAISPKEIWKPVDEATCEVGVGAVTGGVNAQKVKEIDVGELNQKISSNGQLLLLDVRQPEEYGAGHIPETKLIPLGEFTKHLEELEDYKGKEIITICRSGGRSKTAASILLQLGFENVSSLKGGMLEWQKQT